MNESTTNEYAQAAKRVMNRPASLADAIKQDINSLLPSSEQAVKNRERVKKFGITVLAGAGIAFVAAVGVDKFAPPVEVGSTVVTQNQGEGLIHPIVAGLEQISQKTGVNVSGADYREGVADLAHAGVDSGGHAGLNIEVTAYKSPIFGNTSVSAKPAETDLTNIQLPMPPALDEGEIPSVNTR